MVNKEQKEEEQFQKNVIRTILALKGREGLAYLERLVKFYRECLSDETTFRVLCLDYAIKELVDSKGAVVLGPDDVPKAMLREGLERQIEIIETGLARYRDNSWEADKFN